MFVKLELDIKWFSILTRKTEHFAIDSYNADKNYWSKQYIPAALPVIAAVCTLPDGNVCKSCSPCVVYFSLER